jgi:energy-coupling factor transport system ATP-binding protein
MEISVEDISFTYPGNVRALDQVSLRIGSGERAAIIGQNGAGKTTLVKHFNGLLKPSAGRVSVGGWDTSRYSSARLAARVGYVFQNPDDQLFQSSVLAEVKFGPKKLGWDDNKLNKQVQAMLDLVELSEFANRHPYDLSPGQRKRVAMASVLAMDTPIVILDEPTTGQDQSGINLLGKIIAVLKKKGKTVITITHDIDFCAENFERVIVMAQGRVLLDGPARNVLGQAEILAQTYVEPPQLVRLANRLGIEETPLNVNEFLTARYGFFDTDASD